MVVQPGTQVLGLRAIDTGCPGVLLDASERRRQVLAGGEPPPGILGGGGVRLGGAWRREATLLFAGSFGLHPRHPLREGPAKAGWLLWLPRARARFASASRSALRGARSRRYYGLCDSCRVTGRLSATGVERLLRRGRHSGRPPRIGAATFLAHPPASTLRSLEDHGLRRVWPSRPDRPAFYAVRVPRSRFRLHLPSHPASRRRSWLRLEVSVI